MDNLNNKISIYKLIKYKNALEKIQLEETQPIINNIKTLLSHKCRDVRSEALVGKYFRVVIKGHDLYLRFDKFDEKDGALMASTSYPRHNEKRIGYRNRKFWICNYYAGDQTYQVFDSEGQAVLEEINKEDFESVSILTKWKKLKA